MKKENRKSTYNGQLYIEHFMLIKKMEEKRISELINIRNDKIDSLLEEVN